MAFTIKKRESYCWTVEHAIEKREGKTELMVFDAEFRALPSSRIDALLQRARDAQVNDVAFLDEILIGWHGLRAEDGTEFAHSEEHLRQLLEVFPGITAALMRAWVDSVVGGGAARKN